MLIYGKQQRRGARGGKGKGGEKREGDVKWDLC